MSFHVYHVIRSLGIGGAQTMLFELMKGFERDHPDITQSLHLINTKSLNKGFVESYNIDYVGEKETHFVKRVLRHKGPRVVVYHKLMMTNTDFLRPFSKRVPVVVVNHTFSESISYNRIRHADQVVAVCSNMKKTLLKFRIPAPIEVILNGIDTSNFESIQPANIEKHGKLLTGRVNALNKIKYNDDWVKWCLYVDLPKPMIHEYMGGGEFIKKARNIATRSPDPKNEVRILGNFTEFDKKVARIKSWDLFLYHINRHEGLSIAVLEAMACGVPVVCSNHHGNKEIIKEGVNGFVFRNYDELEHILIELCLNEDLLLNLRESTLDYCKNKLNSKITCNKYREVIEKIINSNGAQKTHKAKNKDLVNLKRKKIQVKDRVMDKALSEKEPIVQQSRQKIVVEETKKNKEENTNTDGNDKFTILTSSYNNAAWLEDWADSILRQSYRPLEVVFVDDANKDKTPEIIKKLAPRFKDAGIELISLRNENQLYCASSYQRGFNEATGYFMGILDSDDMLTTDAVEYIMSLYKRYPDVGWIYTQFETCTRNMSPKSKGFCRAPDNDQSLLDYGKNGKHMYSHWRTFSKRVPKLGKIWKPGLKCAVDKYMGYRLEEWSKGMFTDKICYKYRSGVKQSISTQGKSKIVWRQIIAEASSRRKRYKLKAHPIIVHKD